MQFDEEKGDTLASMGSEFMFSEKSVRQGFIRKVYGILLLQLLLTTAVITLFMTSSGIREYVRSPSGAWLLGASFVGVMAFLIVMACVEKARRTWPINIICLLAFTVFESISLGALTCHYDTELVLMAAVITCVVTLGLTLFALQTKYDFTVIGGGLFVCLFAMIGCGILFAFMPSRAVQIVYSSAGAVIFGLYIIFDTQMMLGGKHKYSVSPEEYVFAALNLYLDIINLFIHILSILSQNNRG